MKKALCRVFLLLLLLPLSGCYLKTHITDLNIKSTESSTADSQPSDPQLPDSQPPDVTAPNTSGIQFDDGISDVSTVQSPLLHWNAATDEGSGISRYEIAVGTASGLTDVQGWTSVGNVTQSVITNLTLTRGNRYYASLRAIDNAGNISNSVLGNGWLVEYLPLEISPSALNLDLGSKWKFSASGGKAPYTYSLIGTQGSFNSSTQIYTANTTGGYNVTIRVTDANNTTSESIVTVDPAPVVTCSSNMDTYALFGTFTDTGGTSSNYPNWEWCNSDFFTYGAPISIHFNSFSIQAASYDYMEIFNSQSTSFGIFKGNSVPGDFQDASGNIFIQFDTDGAGNGPGWEMTWSSNLSATPYLTFNKLSQNLSAHLGFVANSVDLKVVSGTGPYTFSIVSGAGTISNVSGSTAKFIPTNVVGVTTVRATDVFGAFSEHTYTVYQNAFTVNAAGSSWLQKTGAPVSFSITGTGFLPGAKMKWGNTDCTTVTVGSSTVMSCSLPASSVGGCQDLVITNGDQVGSATLSNRICFRYGSWSAMPSPSTATRREHASIWTGDRFVIWGGQDPSCAEGSCTKSDGFVYNPLTDSWSSMSASPLGPRIGFANVWTGHEVLFFGGKNGGGNVNDGAKYNPYTDTWTSISSPSWQARQRFSQVWTGNELILNGGQYSPLRTESAAYDPITDTWRENFPPMAARWLHRTAWSGSKVLLFGGAVTTTTNYTNTGEIYDPSTNTWLALPTPTLRDKSLAQTSSLSAHNFLLWIGDKFFVGGGNYNSIITTGNLNATYDIENNQWNYITNIPSMNYDSSSIWTGDWVILSVNNSRYGYNPATQEVVTIESATSYEKRGMIWTGKDIISCYGSTSISTGGTCERLNLGELNHRLAKMNYDSWINVTSTSAPSQRSEGSSIWSGKYMITWGGYDGTSYLNNGKRYDPFSDSWLDISSTSAPSGRKNHSALWVGSRMIIWGGETAATTTTNSGGIYNPFNDSWTATTISGSTPSTRKNHSVVWTGSKMIVWGGEDGSGNFLGNGAIFDFSSNSWSSISATNAPSARARHKALWTGSKMIIWGGSDNSGYTNTGYSYDLASDTWTALSNVSAPSARADFSMALARNAFVIWGGVNSSNVAVNTGGIYDLNSNTWQSTSLTNAPSARRGHSSVYTDRFLIVSQGNDGSSYFNDSYEFNPMTNTWTTLSASGLSARSDAMAIWTGGVGDGRANGSSSYRNNLTGDTGRMILWGGKDGTGFKSDGKIYNLNNQ